MFGPSDLFVTSFGLLKKQPKATRGYSAFSLMTDRMALSFRKNGWLFWPEFQPVQSDTVALASVELYSPAKTNWPLSLNNDPGQHFGDWS